MSAPSQHRVATLKDHVGHDFGWSSPAVLDQSRINRFADCTGDDQWIHDDAGNVLAYGFDKVRFLAPVTSGNSIVIRVELAEVESKGLGRTLVRCRNTAFLTGDSERPVMVAESLGLVLS
jgi:acyl dehydratase